MDFDLLVARLRVWRIALDKPVKLSETAFTHVCEQAYHYVFWEEQGDKMAKEHFEQNALRLLKL